ncbi:hypothetical protein OHA63_04025 [Streptomyces anulatus]|nr:hypothetical protein [Streptomyces anulatus]
MPRSPLPLPGRPAAPESGFITSSSSRPSATVMLTRMGTGPA